MKVLIYGLKNAGKTCLIQNVLAGKSWKDLEVVKPTEFIDSQEYVYRGLLKIDVFDCGGQEQFLKQYHEDEWKHNVFSNCSAFYFEIDSSNIVQLNNAKKEFYKAFTEIKKSSSEIQKVVVVISKCDVGKKPPKQIREFIFDHPDYDENVIDSISISIPKNTARKNFGKLLNNLIPDELKSKQQKLDNLCIEYNKKFKSIYSLILNKKDGLEIASATEKKLVSSNLKEEIEYTSLKVLLHSEEESKIFKLLKSNKLIYNNKMHFRTWETKDSEHIITLQDFSKNTGFFAIFKYNNFNYDRIRLSMDVLHGKINKIIYL